MGHKRRAVESAAESVGWPLKCWKWWEISNLFQISNFKWFPDSWPDSSRTDQERGMHLNWSGMREPYPNVQKSPKYPLRYGSLIPDQIQVGLIRNEGTLMSSKIPIGICFPDSWLDPSWTDQEWGNSSISLTILPIHGSLIPDQMPSKTDQEWGNPSLTFIFSIFSLIKNILSNLFWPNLTFLEVPKSLRNYLTTLNLTRLWCPCWSIWPREWIRYQKLQ